ncbi:hypothetical protein JBL43_12940 [Aureibaculum sp. A20]|uniref:DUF6438 domain-containing protein n=1 Tax=Aureibaculum flavum TaxID=2795986 RepID=A0ABS0WT39_9FLAO|nr:hypothetical protein [Aureibaculum flavum]MBJ2175152.1 hypothetical protein [Aureibaculum flavum]
MQKLIVLFLLFTSIVACQKPKVNDSNENNNTDFSTLELKVERGAFHYDTFVLKDSTITFYPQKEMDSLELSDSVEYQDYYTTSEKAISKADRDTLVQKIIAADIWDLKEEYTPNESCTSMLTVTFSLNGKTKKIVSEDFDRGCPEIIKYIESELVRLHGKKLKRIFLPG